MTAVNPGQAIVIEGVPNLRDMGGWPAPGGVVASGEVYRSAEFSGLTGEAATAFAALGVRAVYDLRTTDERAAQVSALAPYTASGGDADAYVRTVAEPDINDTTINYIENYVPDHSGEHYRAHVTVGVAKVSDLETFEAEQLPPLTFTAGGISIYQLGNNGTAARHLKSWSAA